jgi:hypothetical protein
MANLDLDIRNYSVNDLESFFQMTAGKKYTAADIEQKEYEIRETLLKSGHVDKKMKTDVMTFLTQAKDMLIFMKCESVPPTSLPKEPRLDKSTYLEQSVAKEENLIRRQETPYVNTFNSEYYAGTMNPLATRTIKKCLNIDTRFRENYYSTKSSDFTIQIPTKFSKVVSMQLSSIEIPVTFYGISQQYGNHFLYLEITYTDSSSNSVTESNTYTIPDGNYNAGDFITLINRTISPVNSLDEMVDPNNMFSYVQFTLDIMQSGSGTGKVILSTVGIKGPQITNIRLDFTRDINGNTNLAEVPNRIGWNLGFTRPTYNGSTRYVSDTIIEPAAVRYVYLAIDDFHNSVNDHFVTAFSHSILNPNILARISLKGSYFSLLMENDLNIVTEPRKYFGPVDIQRLRIRLYDDRGRILDMNNANFSFCLIFTMLYDL